MSGSLVLCLGPMGAGKTRRAINECEDAAGRGRRAVVVRPLASRRAGDAETDAVLRTHDPSTAAAPGSRRNGGSLEVLWTDDAGLADFAERELALRAGAGAGGGASAGADSAGDESPRPAAFIAVDEGQMFGGLDRVLPPLAAAGADIWTSALNGDIAQRPFPAVAALLPHCDRVVTLQGHCARCRDRDSVMTVRARGAGRPSGGADLRAPHVEAGGFELYEPVCRTCASHTAEEDAAPAALGRGS